MTRHIVHSFPTFFASSDRFREMLETGFDPRRKGGGGGGWSPPPGEGGF